MRGNPAKFFREGAALVAKALREPQGEKPMSDNPAKFSRGDTAFIMTALRKAGPHNQPVTGVVVLANAKWIRVNIYGHEYRFKKSAAYPECFVEEGGNRVALTSWDAILEYQEKCCA